ncbi:MAG: hypothetical protein KDD33_03575 [Bdellovibrionales bacterium]|nr:hypothetical protein [Bdellovibrionales bacterium]
MKFVVLAIFAMFLCSCMTAPVGTSQSIHPEYSELDDIERMLLSEQEETLQANFDLGESRHERNDVKVGMARRSVQMHLGSPSEVEQAGNPKYGNERWTYEKSVPTLDGYYKEKKVIYFEGGEVVGWETK